MLKTPTVWRDKITNAVRQETYSADFSRLLAKSDGLLAGGWIAQEALAIGICRAVAQEDFADGLPLAVNQAGDRDSTGSTAGNVLGAELGLVSVSTAWLDELEFRAKIDRITIALDAIAQGPMTSKRAREVYPGW